MDISNLILVMLFALLIGVGLSFFSLFLFKKRKHSVSVFRIELLGMAAASTERLIMDGFKEWGHPLRILEKTDFKKMERSLRPLVLEEWFSPDEILLLTYANDN